MIELTDIDDRKFTSVATDVDAYLAQKVQRIIGAVHELQEKVILLSGDHALAETDKQIQALHDKYPKLLGEKCYTIAELREKYKQNKSTPATFSILSFLNWLESGEISSTRITGSGFTGQEEARD